MLVNLLKSEPELLMCASLIVSTSGDNVLTKSLVMLWQADPMPEMIGHMEISGLWVLGRP